MTDRIDRWRYQTERTITSYSLSSVPEILTIVKQEMLRQIFDRVCKDRDMTAIDLNFDFSYSGCHRSEYDLADRHTPFYDGFPDVGNWEDFGDDWQKWDLVIQLHSTVSSVNKPKQ